MWVKIQFAMKRIILIKIYPECFRDKKYRKQIPGFIHKSVETDSKKFNQKRQNHCECFKLDRESIKSGDRTAQ